MDTTGNSIATTIPARAYVGKCCKHLLSAMQSSLHVVIMSQPICDFSTRSIYPQTGPCSLVNICPFLRTQKSLFPRASSTPLVVTAQTWSTLPQSLFAAVRLVSLLPPACGLKLARLLRFSTTRKQGKAGESKLVNMIKRAGRRSQGDAGCDWQPTLVVAQQVCAAVVCFGYLAGSSHLFGQCLAHHRRSADLWHLRCNRDYSESLIASAHPGDRPRNSSHGEVQQHRRQTTVVA